MTKELKKELSELSKEVFGSSSRWEKLVKSGRVVPETEQYTQYIPNENGVDGESKQVTIPLMHKGIAVSKIIRYTPESVKQYMLDLKAKRNEFIKKLIEEQQSKKQQEFTQEITKASGASL